MKASETRQKAREFLKTLSGKYQLFLVSIILAILTISISYTETYHINGTTVNATASVPGIVSILSALFLASASYAVLDVIRHKRDYVEVGDNMRGSIIFVAGVTATTSNNSNGGIFVTIIGFVLMVAGFALSIIKQYSYSMTTYVLYDAIQNGTYEGPRSVINKSTELMTGNKWRYFCLQFSFIGWYILTGLTFGLLHFYTLPYTTTATLFFYEDLLDKAE